jgi:hypothetical protein
LVLIDVVVVPIDAVAVPIDAVAVPIDAVAVPIDVVVVRIDAVVLIAEDGRRTPTLLTMGGGGHEASTDGVLRPSSAALRFARRGFGGSG